MEFVAGMFFQVMELTGFRYLCLGGCAGNSGNSSGGTVETASCMARICIFIHCDPQSLVQRRDYDGRTLHLLFIDRKIFLFPEQNGGGLSGDLHRGDVRNAVYCDLHIGILLQDL